MGNRPYMPIASDAESVTTDLESNAGSSFLSGASKEQISSVLHKLQGRASSYKDKYRDLVRQYNEVVRDNDKIRKLLVVNQDKTIRRNQQMKEEKALLEASKRELFEKLEAQDRAILLLRAQVEGAGRGEPVDLSVLDRAPPAGAEAMEIAGLRENKEKMERLLTKCKTGITERNEKIAGLKSEVDKLQKAITTAQEEKAARLVQEFKAQEGGGEAVAERVAGEWRRRLESAEAEWNEKVKQGEETSAMAVAQAKAEMHEELERRDALVTSLTAQLRKAEERSGNADAEKQGLEEERTELLEKMHKAKSEAIRLIQEEVAEKQKKALVERDSEWEEKLASLSKDCHAKLIEKDQDCDTKVKEIEEQMSLAIEEREMQKASALTSLDAKTDSLREQLSGLHTRNLELEGQLSTLQDSAKTDRSRLEGELANAKASLSDTSSSQSQVAQRLEALLAETQAKDEELTKLRKSLSAAESETAQLKSNLEAAEAVKQEVQRLESDLGNTKAALNESTSSQSQVSERLEALLADVESKDEQLNQLRTSLTSAEATAAQLKTDLEAAEATKLDVQRLEFELKTTQEQLQSVTTVREEMEAKLAASEVQLMEARQSVQSREEELARKSGDVSVELSSLKDQLVSLQTTLSAKEEMLSELTAAVAQKESDFQSRLAHIEEENNKTKSALESELSAKATAVEQKETELSSLKDQLVNLQTTLEAKEKMLTELKDSATQKEGDFQSRLAHIEEEGNKTKAALESEIETKLTAVEQLESDYDRLKAELEEEKIQRATLQEHLQFSSSELSSEVEELKRRVECYKSSVAGPFQQFQEMVKDDPTFAETTTELGEFSKEAESPETLKDAVSSFLRQIFLLKVDLESKTKELSEQNRTKEEALQCYQAQETGASSRIESMASEKASLETKLAELEAEKTKVAAGMEQLHAETTTLKEELATKDKEMKSVQKQAQFAVEEKNFQISELTELLGGLEDAVDVYKVQLKEREAERKQIRKRLESETKRTFFESAESQQRMEEMGTRVSDLEEAVDIYRKTFIEKKTKIKEMEQVVHSKDSEIQSVKTAISQLLQDNFFLLKEKELELDKERERVDELEEALEAYRSQSSILQSKQKEVKKSTAKLQEEAKELKVQLEETQKTVELTRQESEKALKEKEDILVALTEKEETVEEFKTRLDKTNEELTALKNSQLANAKAEVANLRQELEKSQRAEEEIRTRLSETLKAQQAEVAEKSSVAQVLQNQIQEQELQIQSQKAELDSVNLSLKEVEEKSRAEKEAGDAKVADYKKKAESKLSQIKTKLEKDREAAVTELETRIQALQEQLKVQESQSASLQSVELQLAELESRLREKDSEMEAQKDRNEATLSAKTGEVETLRAELETLKTGQSASADAESVKAEYEKKMTEMIDEHNEKVKTLARELQEEMHKREGELETEIKEISGKSEEDRNRMVKEYQREVKDLYRDLNERSVKVQELQAELGSQISGREAEAGELRAQVKRLESQVSGSARELATERQRMEEEVSGLHQEWINHGRPGSGVPGTAPPHTGALQSQECERQATEDVSSLQEKVRRLEAELVTLRGFQGLVKARDNDHQVLRSAPSLGGMQTVPLESNGPRSPLYDEPTEFEYLRNVLYRYMMERETLGKESVTLARVIATVLRFSGAQSEAVMAKEESRLSAW